MFNFLSRTDHEAVPSQKPIHCPIRSEFGKNVGRLRVARGLTQEALAEMTGISTRYAQSIEAGEYFPALPTLAKLRRALGATSNDLFNGLD